MKDRPGYLHDGRRATLCVPARGQDNNKKRRRKFLWPLSPAHYKLQRRCAKNLWTTRSTGHKSCVGVALARGLSGRPLGSGDDDKEEHSFLFRAIAQTKCADLRSVQPATHQEDTNFPLPSPPRATSSSSDREQLEICPYYRDNPRAHALTLDERLSLPALFSF